MHRRFFLKWSSLLGLTSSFSFHDINATNNIFSSLANTPHDDRAYWIDLLNKIATPVLANMSKGLLREKMPVQFSPTWDGRNKEVAYMEGFARLIGGIAPFLNLPVDNTVEGRLRAKLRNQVQASLTHAVNPQSPDYLFWGDGKTPQVLVDAAYIAQAFLYAPKTLWYPLSEKTKKQFIHEFTNTRKIKPFKSNWLLFAAIIESFLLSVGEEIDEIRIDNAIDQMLKWYVGDGWYTDGDKFHFDHYNGYVIHPMLVDVLRVNIEKGRRNKKEYDLAYKRMQRYSTFLERYISPEGTYLVVGRSSTYRLGAFQPLVKLALEDGLPEDIKPAQVRCALTKVMKRMFIPSTFTNDGWLTLGLLGNKQESLADYYSNTGSMYITALIFLALGLPASHKFWSDPFTEWTQLKAWGGKPFPMDHAVDF
ncbi:MAG: DUF2264 domain-containing protein [Niabella sp.]